MACSNCTSCPLSTPEYGANRYGNAPEIKATIVGDITESICHHGEQKMADPEELQLNFCLSRTRAPGLAISPVPTSQVQSTTDRVFSKLSTLSTFGIIPPTTQSNNNLYIM